MKVEDLACLGHLLPIYYKKNNCKIYKLVVILAMQLNHGIIIIL